MIKFFFSLLILLTIISCTGKVVEVKSPCVSLDDGPCGKKTPINDWWLKSLDSKVIKS